MRYSVVIRYIGMVLLVLAAFMLASAGISYLSGVDSAYTPLVMSSLLTLLMGCFPLIFVPRTDRISQKEAYCIVVGAWVVASIVGMFPYLMWGGEFTPINAWFESVSGFTTTGASILNDIEALPRGLLFWRMSTSWIGGIGVVMFALVILPSIGKSKMMQLGGKIMPVGTVNRRSIAAHFQHKEICTFQKCRSANFALLS